MNESIFFDTLVEEILAEILSVPIIRHFHRLSFTQLRLFGSQFYYFVSAFPMYLGGVLLHAQDEQIRLAILENFIDECGGVEKIGAKDTADTHPALFRRFTRKLGVSDAALYATQPRSYTTDMVDDLKRLFSQGTFLEAFGGIAPGVESIFPVWIGVIYEGLLQQKKFSDGDLIYFRLHTVVDALHSAILKQSILPYLTSKRNQQLLRRGALAMVNAQKIFFEGLQEEIHEVLSVPLKIVNEMK